MSQRPLSGRERDRLARMKGRKASPPKKRPVAKAVTPPQNSEPAPPQAEEPKVETPQSVTPTPPVEEPKIEAPSTTEQSKTESTPEPSPVYAAVPPPPIKEPEKEVPPPVAQPVLSSSETKSSTMAEHTEDEHHERDATKLVENVSKKPLLYALLALAGLLLVLWVSNTFGLEHGEGHSESENAAAIESPEGGESEAEEAAPVAPVEPEPAGEAEDAAPMEDEGSSETEEGEEATSSETGEVVTPTAGSDGKLSTPFWGIATATVDQENLAQKSVRELRAAGLDARYMFIPDYIPGGKEMYRIFIGPFPDRNAANTALGDVQAQAPGAYPFLVK